MNTARALRLRRKGLLASPPRDLVWCPPPPSRFGWVETAIAVGTLAALAGLLGGSTLLPRNLLGEEVVEFQDEPPRPPEAVKPPPPPPPPPPEIPKEQTPPPTDPNPPPLDAPPPPPQFGFPEGALSDNGGFAVAVGNTIAKKAEEVTKEAPPPLPPAPVPVTSPPDELAPVTPVYPEWAQEQGVTAVVVAQVTIDQHGKVVDVRIVRSGGKDFDQAARAALATARYRPYVKEGRTVPAVFERRFDFQLE